MEIYDFKTGKLVGKGLVEAEPSEEVATEVVEGGLITLLEQLLDLAKKGRLRTVLFTGELADQSILRGWTVPNKTPWHNEYAQYGAAMAVAQEYYNATIGARHPGDQHDHA